jgi:FkbM family methyltransferase
MIKKFKNFIIKILNLFGYRIVGIKKLVKHNNFDSIHQFLINTMAGNNQNIIIFDVGTNDGGSILRFKKIFEKSQIHCFEPTERLLNNIKDSFNLDNIKLNNIALGSQISERNFFFYNSHRVSSFYPMEDSSKYKIQRTIKRLDNKKEVVKKIKVITLDHYCSNNNINHINLLKIDTQGSEAEVLQGAVELLKKEAIDVIELEYILGIAHKDSNSLNDIESVLSEFGYRLIAIESSGNILSFSNYQTNLIYVKKEIFEKIKDMHEKNVDIKDITYSVKAGS